MDELKIYAEVVERQSFSAAAEALGLSKQAVSRHIAQLEARLGVRLLHRSTRKIATTVLGQTYYERIRRVLDEITAADCAMREMGVSLKGRLRASAPLSWGRRRLPDFLNDFLARHEGVELDIALSDRYVDIVGEGFDLAIRIGRGLRDSTLIARKLGEIQEKTVASPAYLAESGTPAEPADLKQHACLLYGHNRKIRWEFKKTSVPVTGRLLSDNGELLCEAAMAHLGIAQLPDFLVDDALAAGRLVSILEAHAPAPSSIYAVYPPHREANGLQEAFVRDLKAALSAGRG
jgi:DNA-binding transcriptional LysR family regulator